MAVIPADLIAPRGLVESSLFPGEDVTARVQAYIVEAEAVTTDERAIAAWAYYRAFYAAYVLLTTRPATMSHEDQGSTNYLLSQINNVLVEAERWRAVYDDLTAPTPTVTSREAHTASLRNDFTW